MRGAIIIHFTYLRVGAPWSRDLSRVPVSIAPLQINTKWHLHWGLIYRRIRNKCYDLHSLNVSLSGFRLISVIVNIVLYATERNQRCLELRTQEWRKLDVTTLDRNRSGNMSCWVRLMKVALLRHGTQSTYQGVAKEGALVHIPSSSSSKNLLTNRLAIVNWNCAKILIIWYSYTSIFEVYIHICLQLLGENSIRLQINIIIIIIIPL